MSGGMVRARSGVVVALLLVALSGAAVLQADETETAAAPAAADLFRQAYEISTKATGRTVADYRRMIELCLEGLGANPDPRNAAYGRQLAVWAYERWGKGLSGTAGPEAQADASALIHAGSALLESGLSEAESATVGKYLSEALTVRGEARFDDNQLEAAAQDLGRAVELDRTNWRALQSRGVLRAMNGQYDEALADFDQVLRLNPRYGNAWFNRGEIQYQRGDYDAALQSYSNALQLNPNDAAALVSRGHSWYRKRDYRRAIADFNAALSRDPNNAEALTHRGIAYCDLGVYKQAADDFRAAFRIDPDNGQGYVGAGWLMATCPESVYFRPDEALRAAEKAIELDGEANYRYLDVLAAALAANERFEEAVAKQTVALEMAEGQPEIVLKELQDRLAHYQEGKPYREKAR